MLKVSLLYQDSSTLTTAASLTLLAAYVVLVLVLYYRLFMVDYDHLSKLVKDIAGQGVGDKSGVLTEPAYELITESVPLVCVDIIPVQVRKISKIGIISRATGPERGKPALLGGRIRKNETIKAAICRHLLDSFGSGMFNYHRGNSEDHPFYVQQFFHGRSAKPPYGYDPTKHSVTMAYLVNIKEPKQVGSEASAFRWIGLEDLPDESAYNHHLVMRQAAIFLKSLE